MDYYKLLNDYLNFENYYKDCDVLSFIDKGSYIEVYYSFNDKQERNERNIDLFDLITFAYSKT